MRTILQRINLSIVAISMALGLIVFFLLEAYSPSLPPSRPAEFHPESSWISHNDDTQYGGCFRLDLDLNKEVAHAWLLVGCEQGFELSCNGNAVGAFNLWRATRPFQNGLTEAGHRAVTSDPSMALNFAREYQWTTHANHRLPVYFDIRPALQGGQNTICLEVEGRFPKSRIRVSGEITLTNGEVIPIRSNAGWKAEPTPKDCGYYDWFQPKYDVTEWQNAITRKAPSGENLTLFEDDVFKYPFKGQFLSPSTEVLSSRQPWSFVHEWNEEDRPKSSWLKIATTVPYIIEVNGEQLRWSSKAYSDINNGGWMIRWQGRRYLEIPPTLVDPDEVKNFFTGYRFEDPRHGDPTVNDFKRFENTLNRTKERPNKTGNVLEEPEDPLGEAPGRLSDPYGFYEEADARVPFVIRENKARETFHGFDISDYTKKGKNSVRIKVLPELEFGYQPSRPPRIAVNIGAKYDNSLVINRGSVPNEYQVEWADQSQKAFDSGLSEKINDYLPELFFIGCAYKNRPWKRTGLLIMGLTFLTLLFFNPKLPLPLSAFAFTTTSLCLGSLALRAALFERSEIVWFRSFDWPLTVLFISLIVSTIVAVLGKSPVKSFKRLSFKKIKFETVLLIFFCVLVFITRSWNAAHQPIDDDEFASIQAIVSIAKTGFPEIAPDIFYSRSPLYHYLVGAVTWIFGNNLMVMRMFTALTSVATLIVLWHLCRLVTQSRFVRVAAALIFILHPFLIFTGHIARFYQQQQLLVVLTIYCFIRGFVLTAKPSLTSNKQDHFWQVWTLISFACAILSQEISIAMAPTIGLIWLAFSRKNHWKNELKLVLLCIPIALAVALDIIMFQFKCLTVAPGVSPNVEATIAPTFWSTPNLFSMLIANSRLHVLLSAFIPFSLVRSWKNHNQGMMCVHAFLWMGIIGLNLMISSNSFRYQYALIALWIIVGVHGIQVVREWVSSSLKSRQVGMAIASICLLFVLLSFSPWKIPGSYEEKILGDPITSLRYINAHRRPDDKIMITEPHAHAAKMELGQVDYDLVVPILYDFTYNDKGLLRDRNGNAEVVNRLHILQNLFAEHERIWILVNREKFRSRKKNIRWEYPSAREELFLRKNCQIEHRGYLWTLYLWDRNNAHLHTFRKESNSWVE